MRSQFLTASPTRDSFPAQVPHGRRYWVVWAGVGPNGAGGRGLNGLVASEMTGRPASAIRTWPPTSTTWAPP